jgi:uncharacterized Zn-finger protein
MTPQAHQGWVKPRTRERVRAFLGRYPGAQPRDIAAALGISTNAVHQVCHRERRSLGITVQVPTADDRVFLRTVRDAHPACPYCDDRRHLRQTSLSPLQFACDNPPCIYARTKARAVMCAARQEAVP